MVCLNSWPHSWWCCLEWLWHLSVMEPSWLSKDHGNRDRVFQFGPCSTPTSLLMAHWKSLPLQVSPSQLWLPSHGTISQIILPPIRWFLSVIWLCDEMSFVGPVWLSSFRQWSLKLHFESRDTILFLKHLIDNEFTNQQRGWLDTKGYRSLRMAPQPRLSFQFSTAPFTVLHLY